jgi:hypothetical protein
MSPFVLSTKLATASQVLSGETKVIQRGVDVSDERLRVLFDDAHAFVPKSSCRVPYTP